VSGRGTRTYADGCRDQKKDVERATERHDAIVDRPRPAVVGKM
jgi:hypothetical protein